MSPRAGWDGEGWYLRLVVLHGGSDGFLEQGVLDSSITQLDQGAGDHLGAQAVEDRLTVDRPELDGGDL